MPCGNTGASNFGVAAAGAGTGSAGFSMGASDVGGAVFLRPPPISPEATAPPDDDTVGTGGGGGFGASLTGSGLGVSASCGAADGGGFEPSAKPPVGYGMPGCDSPPNCW